MNTAALTGIDEAIEAKSRQIERIRLTVPGLAELEADLVTLKRARQLLSVEARTDKKLVAATPSRTPPSSRFQLAGPMPIADAIETVLKVSGEMHADELLRRVEALGVLTTKASMVSTLIRYARRQKRFKRTGKPNTFALL